MLAAVSISLCPSVDYTSTVNFLERDHPWRTRKWSLKGDGRRREKKKKKMLKLD